MEYIFCWTPNLIKSFQECQHYEDINFHEMKYDLKGHSRSYKMKICVNSNIMKTHIFHKIYLKRHFYVMKKFFFYFKTLWPHYNLDLRSYGQLLSLFSIFRNELINFGWEKLLNLFIFFIMILPLWNCLFFSSLSSSIAFFKKKIRVNMAKIWLKRYIF